MQSVWIDKIEPSGRDSVAAVVHSVFNGGAEMIPAMFRFYLDPESGREKNAGKGDESMAQASGEKLELERFT